MTTLAIQPTPGSAARRRSANGIVRRLPGVARVLMGALFLFSGMAGLLVAPSSSGGLPAGAADFAAALAHSGYMMPLVSVTEAVVGLLLLSNRFVPLALVLLAPVAVNIFAFHLFLAPSGLPVAVVVCALELYLAWGHRAAYRTLLAARPPR